MTDPSDPYRYVEIRGIADKVEPDPGNKIDHLSQRYLGQSPYRNAQPGEERVVVHIRPVDSSSMG